MFLLQSCVLNKRVDIAPAARCHMPSITLGVLQGQTFSNQHSHQLSALLTSSLMCRHTGDCLLQ